MPAMQHIAMNCIDRHRQEAFYTRHFGFRRARVFNPGTKDEFVMLRNGAVCMEFFDVPEGVRATGGEQPVGFKHLAFEVDDIEATIRALQADGVETGELIDCDPMVPGMRVCFFRDPDGNILEIMENWSDEENPPQA